MRFTRFSAFLTLFSAFLAPALPARAQCEIPGWTAGAGTFTRVYAMLQTASGNLIVAGDCNDTTGVGSGGTLPSSSLVCLNPNTGMWSMLTTDTNGNFGRINALAELPGGDIVATGEVGNTASTWGLARINPTTHQISSMGSGFNYNPYGYGQALAVLPGGDLIVGGTFKSVSAVSAANIARYNPATGAWSALGSGTNGIVYSLLVLPSGDLIVGGDFSTAGGISTGKVARYNPTTNTWSSLGSGGPPTVYALAVSPAGDIVAGGMGKISRWNHTTHAWSTMGTVTSSALFNFYTVTALARLPSGDLLVGGDFNKVDSVAASNIARYNWSTGTWSAVGSGVVETYAYEGAVNALLVLPDGNFLAGGNLAAGDVTVIARNLVRCNPSTGVWSEYETKSPNDAITAMAVSTDGSVYAAGKFTKAGAINANGMARYNPVNGLWSAIGSGFSGSASSMLALPSGDVVAGGTFTAADGVPANNIARFSTSTHAWSALGSGVNGAVEFVGVLSNGDLFVSGSFTAAGSVALNGMARYNLATGTWSNAGSGKNGQIKYLVNLPSGEVVLSGAFTSINGVAAGGLARYNPATGVYSELISGYQGFTGPSIALTSDGKLWIWSGYGFKLNSVLTNKYFVAYNLNTGVLTYPSFGPDDPRGRPTAIAVLPNGDLLLSGGFWSVDFSESNSALSPGLARYSPSTGTWTALMDHFSTFDSGLCFLGVLPYGDYVLGGNFHEAITTDGYHSANKYFAHHIDNWAPVIRNQLDSQSACRGGLASLSVNIYAAPGSTTCQWRKNGAPIDGAVNPSALTPTLNLTNIQSSATYDCVVNGYCGTVLSNPATVSVCASDLNCDGIVEDTDFQIFVVQYNILDCADPTMPNACSADINQDGFVDDADFQQFVVAYNILLCQ